MALALNFKRELKDIQHLFVLFLFFFFFFWSETHFLVPSHVAWQQVEAEDVMIFSFSLTCWKSADPSVETSCMKKKIQSRFGNHRKRQRKSGSSATAQWIFQLCFLHIEREDSVYVCVCIKKNQVCLHPSHLLLIFLSVWHLTSELHRLPVKPSASLSEHGAPVPLLTDRDAGHRVYVISLWKELSFFFFFCWQNKFSFLF